MPRQPSGISYTPQWNFLGTGDSTTLQSYNSLNGTYSLILTEPLGDLRYAPIAGGSGYVPYTGATADLVLGAHIVSAQGFAITGTGGLGYINMPYGGDDSGGTAVPTPSSGVNLYSRGDNRFGWKGVNGFSVNLWTQPLTGNISVRIPDVNGGILATINGGQTFTSAIWDAGAVTVNNAVARIYDSAENSELILSHNGIIARSPVGTPAVLQLMGAGGDIRVNETKGDNQGVYWDGTNNEFRIGYKPETYNPILGGDATLSLVRDNGPHTKFRMTAYGNTWTNYIAWNKTRGTQALPTPPQNADVFGSLVGVGYVDPTTWSHGAEYRQIATGTWGATQTPAGHHWRTGILGSTTQVDAMGLGMGSSGIDLELYAGRYKGLGADISGAAGTYRQLIYQTAGSARWSLYTTNTSESGSNAGSDFAILRYADDGVTSNVAFNINRATGDAQFNNNLTVSGSLGSTGTRVVKGWFTDLQVTNAIAGSITGNAATVTTNANLTGAVTSVGNATSLGSFTSAQLATALTNETGSGSVVFSASPILTGTPAIGTGSGNPALQLNGGTGSSAGPYIAFRRNSVDKGYIGSDGGLHANNTDDITISTTADFNLRVGGGFTKRLNISASTGLLQLPAYTTPGVLTNDASGNITTTPLAGLSGGTFTPGTSGLINLTSVTVRRFSYQRVNNIVTVYGNVDIAVTAASGCSFQVDLPIASDLANYELNGNGISGNYHLVIVQGDPTTDKAIVIINTTSIGTWNMSFNYQYEVH